MPESKQDRVTAHIKRIPQDTKDIIALVFSEKQLLELIAVASVALREKSHQKDGYHFAIWKQKTVAKCAARPQCEGGNASMTLARR